MKKIIALMSVICVLSVQAITVGESHQSLRLRVLDDQRVQLLYCINESCMIDSDGEFYSLEKIKEITQKRSRRMAQGKIAKWVGTVGGGIVGALGGFLAAVGNSAMFFDANPIWIVVGLAAGGAAGYFGLKSIFIHGMTKELDLLNDKLEKGPGVYSIVVYPVGSSESDVKADYIKFEELFSSARIVE